jgi:hypothetical protein
MGRKLIILTLSLVLTIILFNIISLIQSKFINSEPTVKVLVANQNIDINRHLDKKMLVQKNVPISLTAGAKVVSRLEEVLKINNNQLVSL